MNRRNFILLSSSTLVLQACGTTAVEKTKPIKVTKKMSTVKSDDNSAYFFASSGFIQDPSRIQLAIDRLTSAGFKLENVHSAYRRHYRFAGTDAERTNDIQNIASGRVNTPKLLIGVRGGYGAIRILPQIDWLSLGERLKEQNSLFMGFSDVCAFQLALLAKSKYPSFAGPMVYSEFGNPDVSDYTLNSFIQTTLNSTVTINVSSFLSDRVETEGIFWGGNLSVLTSLVGTPYMPQIKGGILFLEDVGEQPYRIERMLQTLYLAGILKQQKAIVLGNFRMNNITDMYDRDYNFHTVVNLIRKITKVPVLLDCPFGHVRDKATIPLGVPCKISTSSDGYALHFSDYPSFKKEKLQLENLLIPAEMDDITDLLSSTESTVPSSENTSSIIENSEPSKQD